MKTSDRSTLTVVALGAAATAGVALLAIAARNRREAAERVRRQAYDYSDRRGFPLPADEMRGAARADFEVPEDMKAPAAMAGYSGA